MRNPKRRSINQQTKRRRSPGIHSEKRPQKRHIRAWGYQEAQKTEAGLPGSDTALWLLFFVLLVLVVLFSQRSWLLRLFPLQSSGAEHVQVLRKEGGIQEVSAATGAETDARKNNPGQGPGQNRADEPGNAETQKPGRNWFLRFDKLLKIGDTPDSLNVAQAPQSTTTRLRDVRLFFVRVQEDGIFELKSVLHNIPFDRTPLSRTVEQLLKGPSPQEINKGLHSMLPPELQILGIRIIGATVFLDFNAAFLQIAYLPEVLLAAVKQLVFTLTEYPNVKFLRILVEGQPIFAENLPQNTVSALQQKGIDLNSELRREDLWQGEAGAFAP